MRKEKPEVGDVFYNEHFQNKFIITHKSKMKDRFKFRVWNNRNGSKDFGKVYYDAEETYDYIGGNPRIPASSFDVLLEDDEWIVEQCTGLKDKNGKLIYEGDIVQTSLPYKTNNYEIKWGDGCWELWSKNRYIYTLYDAMCESLSVIGNIHENADLLEQSDVAED